MIDIIESLDYVEQFLVMYGPTIASVITSIASLIVAVFKIRGAVKSNNENNADMLRQMMDLKKTMGDELSLMRRENMQLKQQNRELKQYFTRVAEPEDNGNVRLYKDNKN